jgi:hypothetical protein
MTPRLREDLQTLGALLVTLCLALYVWQGLPFLRTEVSAEGVTAGTGSVVGKGEERLSGATKESAGSFRLWFSAGEDARGVAEVSPAFFHGVEVGDPVDVVFWRGRCLLKEDLRWQPERQRRYGFMLAAASAFGMMTLFRIVTRSKKDG